MQVRTAKDIGAFIRDQRKKQAWLNTLSMSALRSQGKS